MTASVEKPAKEVRALAPDERDQFLDWLAEFGAGQMDEWDREIERDASPGGRLQSLIDRARRDIAAGKTKPLDAILRDQ